MRANSSSTVNTLGKRFQYEQQPNFVSYGALLRLLPYSESGNSVFGQFSFGSNFSGSGLIGRATIGGAFSPIDKLSFIIGIEYDYFLFWHQSRAFNSQKYGFHYGVSYCF